MALSKLSPDDLCALVCWPPHAPIGSTLPPRAEVAPG